jgi:hypothetical protein
VITTEKPCFSRLAFCLNSLNIVLSNHTAFGLGLPFSDKKNYSAEYGKKTEQTAVPSKFHLFLGSEKPRNSILNHFSEEKNPRNSVPNHFWIRKTSEFRSEQFSEEKKLWISIPNHFRKRKNFGNR